LRKGDNWAGQMTIDPLSRLKSLVKNEAYLAQLLNPMCDLLTQAAQTTQNFQNTTDENLGHLEQNLKKAGGEFLRALMEKAAQEKADQTPPKCPECGRKLTRRRKTERAIQTGLGEIKVTRTQGWCSKCQKWFCPGDEALGVESGYSPAVQEMAALFASKMPLAEASAVLERATGIELPPTTLDRVAKQAAGKALKKRQEMDEQARAGGEALARQRPAKLASVLFILLDAWNIRERDDFGQSQALRKKGIEPQRWHWVWMGTVFGLEQRVKKGNRPLITHRGYVATRGGLDALREQIHAEALRHGLGQVKRVVVMADGAAWIWNLAADRFPGAIQRVDLYHIKQHLWTAARELHEDPVEGALWVRKMKQRLKRGQVGKVIASLEEAMGELEAKSQETVKKEAAYLKEHAERMDYHQAQKRGEPVGTGAIESTCRQYQCRFKRPGQFWSKAGDEALLCLETFWRNGRWSHLFPHVKNFDPSKN
jgi:hypothetical protein